MTKRKANEIQSPTAVCRRELCRNKFLIVLAAILLILVYLLSFSDLKYECENCGYTYDHYGPSGSKDLENVYKNELGVIDVLLMDRLKECTDRWKLTAFSGNDIFAHVWEYLSLLVLTNATQADIVPYLSWKSKMELEQVFDKILMPRFTEMHPNCYNLTSAQLLGSTTHLTLDNTKQSTEKVLILRRNAKRYLEICDAGTGFVRNHLEYSEHYIASVRNALAECRRHLQVLDDKQMVFVSIYIDKIMFPVDFYERAINFHRKFNSNAIILAICSNSTLNFCHETFAKNSTCVIRQLPDNGANLALMSYSNHTIIANENAILGALFNKGITVVHESDYKSYPIYKFLTDNFTNWYSIA